ncbi:flagellar hook-basal body complex protein FliE [Thermocrinis sp.]|jgi:flagellar hook-basal body complex protein FliE|uniref:flagellar hook-basal body complex protein FliE n=1 Tax=Thermocrinis sp. TaxID=2024383 RepID=UPI002630AF66|nr:flagellar hook-basal body complex protein FliE [Thermocrinis sp.]
MEIRPINFTISSERERAKTSSPSFLDELSKFIHWVNREQQKAEAIKDAVLKGADIPLHQMVVEFEKASIALNLLIQVRNKLVEAFQELNRMQV